MSSPVPLHFLSIFLQIPTALSAKPFDLGYFGLDVIKLKFHCFAKFLNLKLSNGTLSDMNTAGTP